MTLRLWLKGILAAAIGGASSSVAVMFVDPDHFNFSSTGGLKHLGAVAGVGALTGVVMYLKQSPIWNGGQGVPKA